MSIDASRLPTWSEFLRAATESGIHVEERELGIEGPRGTDPPVRYLQRPDGIKVIVPPLGFSEIVRENLLASLCRRLGMDPPRWGISFDELPPESWRWARSRPGAEGLCVTLVQGRASMGARLASRHESIALASNEVAPRPRIKSRHDGILAYWDGIIEGDPRWRVLKILREDRKAISGATN